MEFAISFFFICFRNLCLFYCLKFLKLFANDDLVECFMGCVYRMFTKIVKNFN